ncbi:hypothetical protein NMY22_g14495 [Coprinellus aureogranulatus]|nr:hypothetical protein NMY22_g14495 [Coprinellus aureogranulatus]
MSGSHTKDPTRVMSGLKASIHNPGVSEEAKDHARQRLADLGDKSGVAKEKGPKTKIIGVKEDEDFIDNSIAAPGSPNPRNTLEGTLDEVEGNEAEHEDVHPEAHSAHLSNRRLAGYKATMHNPRVSKKAKEHAEQILKDNDAL